MTNENPWILIATGDMKKMQEVKQYMMDKFSMVDLKEIRFFLGIKI